MFYRCQEVPGNSPTGDFLSGEKSTDKPKSAILPEDFRSWISLEFADIGIQTAT
jgi:hypothetical protein